jgi:hypothetical protein
MTVDNMGQDRLPQQFDQNLMTALSSIAHAYSTANIDNAKMIEHSFGTLCEIERALCIDLCDSPGLVNAFIHLCEIPLWRTSFFTTGQFYKLGEVRHKSKWDDEVFVFLMSWGY